MSPTAAVEQKDGIFRCEECHEEYFCEKGTHPKYCGYCRPDITSGRWVAAFFEGIEAQ